MSLEQIRYAFNSNAVQLAGVKKQLNLSRGLVVATGALLVRGPSPYQDNAFSQWWLPLVCNVSSPEIVHRRSDATTYALEWRTLFYPDAADGEEMGVLEAEEAT
jgi:hypothetical protein